MPRTRVGLAAAVILVVGCFPIDIHFSTDSESTIAVVVGDLSGPCEGVTSVTEDDATAVVLRVALDGTCAITVEFEATLLDMEAVRQKVEAEILDEGYSPEEVRVSLRAPLTLLVHDLRLEGLDAPSTAWSLDLDLQGRRLFHQTGPDLAALEDAAIAIELTELQLELVDLAYDAHAPVRATGQLVLGTVPLAYLESLPPGSLTRLTLGLTASLSATGSKDLF